MMTFKLNSISYLLLISQIFSAIVQLKDEKSYAKLNVNEQLEIEQEVKDVEVHTLVSIYDSIVELYNRFSNYYETNETSNHLMLSSKMNNRRSISKQPQSLSILMNFGFDGTSSFHLMDYNTIYWSDSGHCMHGQMFDPLIGVCRDIFCMEGFYWSTTGCAVDYTKNVTQSSSAINIPEEMQIEMNANHKLCTLNEDLSESEECWNFLLNKTDNVSEAIQWAISNEIMINVNRIENFQILEQIIIYKNVTEEEDEEEEDYYMGYDKDYMDTSRSMNTDYQQEEKIKTIKLERLKLSFRLKGKSSFENEKKESIEIYFILIALAIEKRKMLVNGEKVDLSDVIEIKHSDYIGWCGSNGDKTSFYTDGFRILASIEENKRYFVYLNSTGVIYSSGYFFLTIIYNPITDTNKNSLDNDSPTSYGAQESDEFRRSISEEKAWLIDYNNLNLTDVTDIVLETNSTKVQTSAHLALCDRAPKIRVDCASNSTIRLRTCELQYEQNTRSYCWCVITRKCFTIDEYELDPEEPNNYIRVCNQDSNTVQETTSQNKTDKDVSDNIAGWLSFTTTFLSVTAMLFTLITYFLFKDLRNIPGWNIINLTLALTLAQISFILGSSISHIPLLCFIASIMTHYGYLASFFWMNVIAFDLYRNFRKKSSHVLLFMVNVKDRLPKYALFGWLSPLLIVLVCLIIDLTVKSSYVLSPFRPCYAGYLEGCSNITESTFYQKLNSHQNSSLLNSSSSNVMNLSRTTNENENENSTAHCLANANLLKYIYMKTCWIQSGKANLMFFGLPIGIIIVVNAVFYFLTIYNIRQKKRKQKRNKLRRFSKVKVPGDDDVKFYIQMAFIMGFTWVTGFFLATFSADNQNILNYILIYTFIISNSSIGLFIFFAFIFRKEVKYLYAKFLDEKKTFLFGLIHFKSRQMDMNPKNTNNVSTRNVEPRVFSISLSDTSTMSLNISAKNNFIRTNSNITKSSADDNEINSSASESDIYNHVPLPLIIDEKSNKFDLTNKKRDSFETYHF